MNSKNRVLSSSWISTAAVLIVSMLINKNVDNTWIMLIPMVVTLADRF